MFEHVGYKNYRAMMESVHRFLRDEGLFLLHTIGSNETATTADPWVNKYIFPNGMVPSVRQLGISIEGLFIIEDWHNFGSDYSKTLNAWHHNFENNWEYLKSKYDKRFYRMWRFYLSMGSGVYRARSNQLWQIVLSKNGILGGYKSIR